MQSRNAKKGGVRLKIVRQANKIIGAIFFAGLFLVVLCLVYVMGFNSGFKVAYISYRNGDIERVAGVAFPNFYKTVHARLPYSGRTRVHLVGAATNDESDPKK